MIRILPISALLLLAACGVGSREPTVIDGSTPEAFEASFAKAKRDLGPSDRVKFEAAVAEYRAVTFAQADNRAEYSRMYREGLDGLTAPRIVTELDRKTAKLKEDAADAAFDVKRQIAKGSAAVRPRSDAP